MNASTRTVPDMTETPRTPKVAVIAERLTAIRKQAGITQIDMAKKLKVTQSMYSRYERADASGDNADYIGHYFRADAIGAG